MVCRWYVGDVYVGCNVMCIWCVFEVSVSCICTHICICVYVIWHVECINIVGWSAQVYDGVLNLYIVSKWTFRPNRYKFVGIKRNL